MMSIQHIRWVERISVCTGVLYDDKGNITIQVIDDEVKYNF